jgi:hypothetical protein
MARTKKVGYATTKRKELVNVVKERRENIQSLKGYIQGGDVVRGRLV